MKELRVKMLETSEVVYRLEVEDDFDHSDQVKVVEALFHSDDLLAPQVLYTDDSTGRVLEVWVEDADCTCTYYTVDKTDPEPLHPENTDREADPDCPVNHR